MSALCSTVQVQWYCNSPRQWKEPIMRYFTKLSIATAMFLGMATASAQAQTVTVSPTVAPVVSPTASGNTVNVHVNP